MIITAKRLMVFLPGVTIMSLIGKNCSSFHYGSRKFHKFSEVTHHNTPFPSPNKTLDRVENLLISSTIRVLPMGYFWKNYLAKARNLNVLLKR